MKNYPMSIRVPADVREELEREAAKESLTCPQYTRMLVIRAVKARKNKK